MPSFRKPFKIFAIDADTGKPLDPNVRSKTFVKYYTVENGSNGSKKLVGRKPPSDAAKKDEAKDDGKEAGDKKSETQKKKGDGAEAEQKDAGAAWTAGEDEKLRAMKTGKQSVAWKKIAEDLGRPMQACKDRWKEIEGAGGNDKAKKDEGKKDEAAKKDKGGDQGQKGKGNQGGKNANQDKQGDNKKGDKEGKGGKGGKGANDQQKKEAKKEEKASSDKGGTRFTMGDWLTLQEDDSFSFGELRVLSELIARDSERGWQRVASRFFDLTGKRASPDDIREKFESMAAAAAAGGK